MIVLASIFLALRLVADDQIVKKNDQVIAGQILSVDDGQVTVQTTDSRGGIAKFPIPVSDIQSVKMATPDAVAKAEASGTPPADVVATLEPEIQKFSSLKTDWVVDAMARLAQAYAAEGKADKARETYGKIDTLYPGSKYHALAVAGTAEMSFKAGHLDEALTAIQPFIDQANADLAPSPEDGATYAKAFLVYGDILSAQKKPQKALEAYLTVKTMYYQNPTLADEAAQRAQGLRDQNPGLGVE
jgi:tetratricopeptide (TPR) repeat protein